MLKNKLIWNIYKHKAIVVELKKAHHRDYYLKILVWIQMVDNLVLALDFKINVNHGMFKNWLSLFKIKT